MDTYVHLHLTSRMERKKMTKRKQELRWYVLAPYSTHPVTPRTTMHPSGHGLGPSFEPPYAVVLKVHSRQLLRMSGSTNMAVPRAAVNLHFHAH